MDGYRKPGVRRGGRVIARNGPGGFVAGCSGRESVDTAGICVGLEDEDTPGSAEPVSAEVLAGGTLLLEASASFGCHTTDHVVECSVTEEAPGELVVTTRTSWT